MPSHRRRELIPEDLERLRYALGRRKVDAEQSLFARDGMMWRINREGALLLGGGCALLLQVAHPLVAAGVEQHSNFRTQPLQRLWRTLDLMHSVVFGSAKQAIGAIRAIERRHAPVVGRLAESVGTLDANTSYRASDSALQFWVHATLVDTALRVYERVVDPLSEEARAAYYEESKITARLFGIPQRQIPRRWPDFAAYWREMVEGDTLAVGAAGRAVAESILTPPLPFGVRQVFQLPHVFTLGLLPDKVRQQYGYPWSLAHEALLAAATLTARCSLPWLPDGLRLMPAARRALLRSPA